MSQNEKKTYKFKAFISKAEADCFYDKIKDWKIYLKKRKSYYSCLGCPADKNYEDCIIHSRLTMARCFQDDKLVEITVKFV